jgi:2,3-dihydroxybiphenyl 1,2-dioxygenase
MQASPSLALGYLVFGVRRLDRWTDFMRDSLGLPAGCPAGDSRGWRLDDACQRLIVEPDGIDDLRALGLDCGGEAAFEAMLVRLRARGVPVEAGDAALCGRRGARRVALARDPAGNRVELYTGLARAATPFASERFPGGFRTGALGIGHAALLVDDLRLAESFWVDALGLGVSERVHTKLGPMEIDGSFLHCNRRHHSIALFRMPLRKRLHHFMLQAERLADVGASFEHVLRRGVQLSLSLGQHPDPDGTVSYYAQTPSGFDFEIGFGSGEIDPQSWQAQAMSQPSRWGHEPTLRTKVKMAGAFLAREWSKRLAIPAPAGVAARS